VTNKVSCMNRNLFPGQRNCSNCTFRHPYKITSFDEIDVLAKDIADFTLTEVKRAWCSEKIKFFIHLVLMEAIPNAAEHGIAGIASVEKKELIKKSGYECFFKAIAAKWAESGKPIAVTVCVNAERILLGVHDYGEGFDSHMSDLDLDSQGDLLEVSGRGLKMLHRMGIGLHWNEKGNSILCAIGDKILRPSEEVAKLDKLIHTGVEEFDEQHKQMFELFNYIHENIVSGEDPDVNSLVWEELSRYAKMHFLTEEATLENCGFPQLKEHIKEHNFFTSKVKLINSVSDEGCVVGNLEIWGFLSTWWKNHICTVDKEYVPFLNSKGINKPH